MKILFHILYYKLLIGVRMPLSPNIRLIAKEFGSVIVFGSFAAGAYFFTQFLVTFLLDRIGIGLFLFHRFAAMILFVFFLAINVGNVVVSFSTLYRSTEVYFLMTKPVNHASIFLLKFFDNFFHSSGTLLFAATAVLLGYGTHFNFPWYYYPLIMFLGLLPLMFIAGCLAVVLLLSLMMLARKVGFRVLIGSLAAFYLLQIYAYFAFTNPINLANEVMKSYPFVDGYFHHLDPYVIRWLPSFWLADILYFLVLGNYQQTTAYFSFMIAGCAGSFLLMMIAGSRFYYTTWLTSLTLKGERRTSGKKSTMLSLKSIFKPQTEVLIKKEFLQFFRDPNQWIHLSVMAVLIILFLTSAGTMKFKLIDPLLRTTVLLTVWLFNAFLLSSLALRFGFPMVSMEGRSFWTIRSAPVKVTGMYWIKWFIMTSVLIFIAIMLAGISYLPYHPAPLLGYIGILLSVVIAVSAVSINIASGALFSDFNEKNPIRIASSQGATIAFLLTMVFIVIVFGVVFFPVYSLFLLQQHHLAALPDWIPLVLAAMAVFGGIISVVSHLIGLQSLSNDLY